MDRDAANSPWDNQFEAIQLIAGDGITVYERINRAIRRT